MGIDRNLHGINIRDDLGVPEGSDMELKLRSIGEQLRPIINGSSENLVLFQNHLLASMGETDLAVTDQDEKKQIAREYILDAKRILEPSFSQRQMEEVRNFMKSTGNNLGLLLTALLFQEDKDKAGFIGLMAGTISKKAMKEGIPINIPTRNYQELIDAANTFGQNYPSFEGKDGRASLIACLEDALGKYDEMQPQPSEKEEHIFLPDREEMLQSVIENRPGFQENLHSFDIEMKMDLFINVGGSRYFEDRSGFFQNVEQLRQVLWGILDPELGEIKNKPSTERVLLLEGAIDFIRPRIDELSNSDLDLLMLTITDPQSGIGAKDAGSLIERKRLLGFTAELVQRNPSYQKLFQKSIAPAVASQVKEEFQMNGELIDEDFYDRWQNAAIIMALGLNGADEDYYEEYFSFANHFNGMSYEVQKLDATRFIPGKSIRVDEYSVRYSQGYLEGYQPLYGSKNKEYDYEYKFPIVEEAPIEGLSKYIDLSLDYARREVVRIPGSVPNYLDALSNLVVSRSSLINLDERSVYRIVKDLTEVLEEADWKETGTVSVSYENFLNHCLNLISDDKDKLDQIKFQRNDYTIETKTLREMLDTYEKKRMKKEDLSRRIATGVNEGDVIDRHLRRLREDKSGEYLTWMEERRQEFQQLIDRALRVGSGLEGNVPTSQRIGYSNRGNYPNEQYVKTRYRELREEGSRVLVVPSVGFLGLFDNNENFMVDDLWGLFKPENQVISEEEYLKLFNRNKGYGDSYNIMYYTDNYDVVEPRKIVETNIPAIRDFLSNKLLTLPPEHPVLKLIESCHTTVPRIFEQLGLYEENMRNINKRDYKSQDIRDLQRVINYLGEVIITRTVLENEGIVLERTADKLGVVEGTSPRLEEIIGRFSKTDYDRTTKNRASITPVNLSLPPGLIVLLNGPTGSGKSLALDAILTTLRTAMEQGYTTARTVSIPASITRPEDIGDFEMKELPRRSLFQSSAIHEAKELKERKLYGADEPFVGSPEPYKVALITAMLALESARGNYSVVASHQASPIIEILKVLGFGEEVLPLMVDPTSHRISEGVSASYGIDMIDMQGGSKPFVELMQALQYAREQGFSEIEISEILEKLTITEDVEEELGIDDLTIESSHLRVCVGTILNSIVGNDTSGILLDRVMEYFTKNDESIESDIEYFESMETGDVETHVSALNRSIEFYNLTVATKMAIKNLEDYTTRSYDQRSRIDLGELTSTADIIENLKSPHRASFSTAEVEGANYLFGEGFHEVVKEVDSEMSVLGGLKPTEELIANISMTIRGDGNMMNNFKRLLLGNLSEEIITEHSEIFSDENTLEMTKLFFKSYLENPKKYSWQNAGNTDLDKYKLFQILLGGYSKSIVDSFNSQDSSIGKSFNNLQRSFQDISAKRLLGLCVSQYGHGLGDSNIIKFVKPEERLTDDHRVTPLAFNAGLSLSLIDQLGQGYIPQSYYYDGDNPMTPNEDSQIEFLTGLQGGGKTEMLRLMMQLMIYLKYFNRVPAKSATVFWRPRRVVGVIRRPTTERKTSSFMGEAKRIVHAVNRLRKDTVLLYDEPANGTAISDRNDINSAIAAIANHRGANFRLTNHETGIYTTLDRIGGMRYSTLGYTTEESEDFGFRYNFRAGAETFKVAEERGLPRELVDIARFVYETREQLQQHKERIIYQDEE